MATGRIHKQSVTGHWLAYCGSSPSKLNTIHIDNHAQLQFDTINIYFFRCKRVFTEEPKSVPSIKVEQKKKEPEKTILEKQK